mgnify:CR=1 FL=1
MNNKLTVGLLGLSFSSPNLGCSALAYAFRELLLEMFDGDNLNLELFVFSNVDCQYYEPSGKDWVKERMLRYSFRNPISVRKVSKEISRCDVVIDFTEGDSFSDIYGLKRFVLTSYFKRVSIKKAKYFVMGPQTYGPFKSRSVKFAARRLILSADRVYVRDQKSADLVKDMCAVNAMTTTDVAFALPIGKCDISRDDRPRFGLNVSGLLWTGGYTESNQFGLSVDYRQYINRIIPALVERGYTVHLIPHVVGTLYPECDSTICKELSQKYDHCVLAPDFETPMQAKGYISNMDVFSGARMHATIGAFSSGVITIPFSYSPKFEGLYESIGYPYCINGRRLTTDEAVNRTLDYLVDTNRLQDAQQKALERARQNLADFSADFKQWCVSTVLSSIGGR